MTWKGKIKMQSILVAAQGALIQGILWGIMVIGIYITYKILDIADLTVDGSFALGGSVCAILITNNWNPVLALCIAALAGMGAGFVTGFLHTVFEIPAILAGILTQISLWSINLKIMGRSNIPLLKTDTIFTSTSNIFGVSEKAASLGVGLALVCLIIASLYWFFGTEIGSALRATGNNESMVKALGGNTKLLKLFGLMLSNGLVAFSGGLICQSQKYGDIGMGTGAIVIGLAAIIIGGVIMGRFKSFGSKLASAVVGSIIYFMIRAVVLQLGMDPNDMKLISAIIVVLCLCVPFIIDKVKANKTYN